MYLGDMTDLYKSAGTSGPVTTAAAVSASGGASAPAMDAAGRKIIQATTNLNKVAKLATAPTQTARKVAQAAAQKATRVAQSKAPSAVRSSAISQSAAATAKKIGATSPDTSANRVFSPAGRTVTSVTRGGSAVQPTAPTAMPAGVARPQPVSPGVSQTKPQSWPELGPNKAQVILPPGVNPSDIPALTKSAVAVANKHPQIAQAIQAALETVVATGAPVGVTIKGEGDFRFKIVLYPPNGGGRSNGDSVGVVTRNVRPLVQHTVADRVFAAGGYSGSGLRVQTSSPGWGVF